MHSTIIERLVGQKVIIYTTNTISGTIQDFDGVCLKVTVKKDMLIIPLTSISHIKESDV